MNEVARRKRHLVRERVYAANGEEDVKELQVESFEYPAVVDITGTLCGVKDLLV